MEKQVLPRMRAPCKPRPRVSRIAGRALTLLLLALMFLHPSLAAQEELQGKNVLILHADNVFLPANQMMDRAISSILVEAGLPTASIYAEYLEVGRFRQSGQQEGIIRLFRQKYATLRIDLVIITDDPTLDFVARMGASFLPDAPVLLCGITAGKTIPDFLGRKATGNLKTLDIPACIVDILALQPRLEELVVLVGSGRQDSFYRRYLDEVLAVGTSRSFRIRVASDEPLSDSLDSIAALEKDSAVLVLSFYEDGAGTTYNPRDTMALVVQASPVPVYGISDSYYGTGFVGGNLMSFADLGEDAARKALQILRGRDPSEIPMKVFANRNYFDWNALRRWGLPAGSVPEGSVVWNKPPDVWKLYWREIVTALSLAAVVMGFAIVLALQLSLRKKAERRLRDSEYLLDRVVQTNPCMIYVYDIAERKIVFSNRKLRETVGSPMDGPSELDSVLLDSLLHPDDLEKVQSHYAAMGGRAEGQGLPECRVGEYRIKDTGSGWRWCRGIDTVFTRTPDGKPASILGSSVDITQEKEAEERLRASLKEKEVLLRELNHRTKNNMNLVCSLLNLNARSLADPEARRVFSDMTNRIISMSLVHEKLYQAKDLSHISLKQYFGELTRLAAESYGAREGSLRFLLDIEDLACPLDIAISLGLFSNELILNSCRHAFAEGGGGSISIALSRKDADEVRLLYSDDGPGLPEGYDLRRQGSMGTQTLLALGEMQLKGRVDFPAGSGFSCELRFTADLPAFTA